MSVTFIKNLRALSIEGTGDIKIHMQSTGGEWADGMAMYDAIQLCKSKITIVSYGQTESMSTIILQAADRRLLTKNSYFMVHYGTSGYISQYQNVHNWLEYDKKICNDMMEIYSSKCIKGQFFKEKGYDINKVKKYLHRKFKDGDWYMSAEDAVYYGFADGIISTW
jgi:ATP-dependent protease ClpP protease subunit